MITNISKKDKTFYLSSVKHVFTSMGLKILESKIDYNAEKPDVVAIYPDKKKYYVVEVLPIESFEEPYYRINTQDINKPCRLYCNKLFENKEYASVAAALFCDLSTGIEIFNYKSLGTHNFTNMEKYSALIFPPKKTNIVSKVLDDLGIDYRVLDILDDFTFVLISKEDTITLPEKKKFIQFIISNQ